MCIIYVLYVLPLKMEKPSESCGVKERCKALRCNSYLYMFVHIFSWKVDESSKDSCSHDSLHGGGRSTE